MGYTSTLSQHAALRPPRQLSRSSASGATRRRRSTRPRSASRRRRVQADGRLRVPAASSPSAPSAPRTRTRRIASLGLAALRLGRRASTGRSTTSRSQPTLTRLWGGHSVRAGYDCRYRRWDITNPGYGGGRYHFNGAYTRANNAAPPNDRAQSWAQFLLGLPTAGHQHRGHAGQHGEPVRDRRAGRLQPDLSRPVPAGRLAGQPQLTVNLGVRLEIERAMTEAEDRNLAGFDSARRQPHRAGGAARRTRANPIPGDPGRRVPGEGRRALRRRRRSTTRW